MKKTVGVLICLLALMVCAGALANVEINEKNFPDANFRQYILDNIDSDKDDKLSDSEISAVTDIDCGEKEIKNLKGIEYFTALTSLSCYDNQLTTLDVSKNTDLDYLACSRNQLTSLDIGKNTDLNALYCDENQLTILGKR